ncbi:MAG: class I SAM-dependent methyltransferase [Gemmatimonadaceae bacterium]
MTDWFEEWFGEEYLALYDHRDDREAQRVTRLIESRVKVPLGAPALDLACGAGRHQRALHERWWTVGLDLSPSLLRVARDSDRLAPLVRADMRELPFENGSFQLVVNLFTSFGYFATDAEHRRVIAEVARVTCRGGWFVLDFLHAAQVRRTLVARDVRLMAASPGAEDAPETVARTADDNGRATSRGKAGRTVTQERRISGDGRFVEKAITVVDLGRTFVERVRLFEPPEIRVMLQACGFATGPLLGDYDGSVLDQDSPRCIAIGRRE